jgi:hypothetical protein
VSETPAFRRGRFIDKCIVGEHGYPEQQVKATTSVEHANITAAYSEAGFTSGYTTPDWLTGTPQPLFGTQEYETNGNQLAGTFTYTTPAGANVTATYQWLTGNETPVPALGSYECVFSGIAEIAGG